MKNSKSSTTTARRSLPETAPAGRKQMLNSETLSSIGLNDERIASIIRNLLKGDSSLLEEAVKKNLKNNDVAPAADVSEIDTDIVEKIASEEMFIHAVAQNLIQHLISNQEFCKAINLEIEKKVREEVSKSNQIMQNNLLKLKKEYENLAQYTRRNCLIIHGIKEEDNENTNNLAKQFFSKNMEIDIAETDIDRSHRLIRKGGRISNDVENARKKSPPPIIVKFTRHDIKSKIYVI